MKKTHYVLTIVLVCITSTFSCSNKSDFNHFEKIESIKLQGEQVDILREGVSSASNLFIYDSILVIHRSVPYPYYFEAYNLNSGSFIKEFGLQGNGPNELPDYGNSFRYKDRLAIVIPNAGNALYESEIRDLMDNDSSYFIKKTEFTNIHGGDYNQIGDSLYITLSLNSKNRIHLANGKGQNLGGFFDYPSVRSLKELPEDLLGMAHQGYLVKSITDKRVGVFLMNSAGWDIFDFNTIKTPQLVNQSHFNEVIAFDASRKISETSFSKSVAFGTNNPTGFLDLDANDDNIFALYSGKTYEEHGLNISSSNIILKIDWNGDIIEKFTLDQEVDRIVIKNKDYIYCLKEDLNKSTLYKYSLN